jgi:hypothetical protein
MLPLPYKPVQIAYFVSDIRHAAEKMSSITGAGPFFVMDNIELEWGLHRNKPCDFLHSSAYGQWGDVMMELVQQDSDGPSPFRDLYPPGQEGVHHVACFVDSLDATIEQYEKLGYPLAARAKAKIGTEFAFIDISQATGHMLEIYVADENLLGFYRFVKAASSNWDGSQLLRSL